MMQEFTTCAPHELLSDVLAMMHARGLRPRAADRHRQAAFGCAERARRALLAAGNHEEALLRNYVMGIGYE